MGDPRDPGSRRIRRRTTPSAAFITTAILVTLGASARAQLQFDELSRELPPDGDETTCVAVGDVDGDGDLDMAFGNDLLGGGRQNRLCLNDGTGDFSDATATCMPADNDNTRAAALGDVDGDGDLDLVFANSRGSGGVSAQNRLYLNDGSGTFSHVTFTRMPVDNDYTSAVALGDVDEDGDLDLVLGNEEISVTRGQDRLYLNDGTGTFADVTATRMPTVNDYTGGLALGDVDGDGDLDILFGRQQTRLYLNLLRQVDSPNVIRPGGEYHLDTYARYGPPRLVDAVLPYVSSATARIPAPPFGTVGLDPAFAIPLAPYLVPQPAGVGSITETIPNDPALVGLSIHAQALLLQWPRSALLTNVTSNPIVQ